MACLSIAMRSGTTVVIFKRGREKPDNLLFGSASSYCCCCCALVSVAKGSSRNAAERAKSVVRGNADGLRPTSCVKCCLRGPSGRRWKEECSRNRLHVNFSVATADEARLRCLVVQLLFDISTSVFLHLLICPSSGSRF